MLAALRLSLATFLLCGLAYPLGVTALAQALFPFQANGSLLPGGQGAVPIGRRFEGPGFFHGRPSAVGYQAELGGASNLGPTSRALADRVASDAARLRAENPTARGPLPADLLTASGSGLDPDITPEAAFMQVERVAAARRLPPAAVRALVERHVQGRQWGLFGEPRVNVLLLNLALP